VNFTINEKYVCLKNKKYQFNNYFLTPLRKKDIQCIRKWRNNQMSILRQKKVITKEEQINYFESVVKKDFNKNYPKCILFSFILNEICIGYGGLTNINWDSKKTELSFLVDDIRYSDSKKYHNDFVSFIKIITELVFDELNLKKIFTETYDIRPMHIKILEEMGFKLEKRLKQHVNINGKNVDSLIHGYLQEQYIEKQKNFH